jgi:nucleoside-diphosphate-sugar epimerase
VKALVTGTAGFIGSHLAQQLGAEGHEVVGIDSLTDYYDPDRKRSNLTDLARSGEIAFVEADLNSVDLPGLLDGVEVVFHLAGQPGVRGSWGDGFGPYLEQNVRATQRLLEACKGSKVERVVYASSSSIYGDAARFPIQEDDLPAPISPYGVTKLAGEHLVRLYCSAFGLPTVSVRYFTIYGPRQRPDMAFCRFIEAALEGGSVPIFGDGLQVRDFTFVGDAVAATIAGATNGTPGAVYNIAGGAQTTVREVLETVEDLTEKPIQIDWRAAVPGDARRTGADTSRAREELGYEPSVDLREGLRRQVEYVRTHVG